MTHTDTQTNVLNASESTKGSAHRAACLAVIGDAILRVRSELSRFRGDPLAEQLFVLMDAVHNLPGTFNDPDFWNRRRILRELARYDEHSFTKRTHCFAESLQALYQKAFDAAVRANCSIRTHFPNTGVIDSKEKQMTLRTQIETAIRTSPDSGQAAIAVCRLLKDEIGLAGNDWFDDDDELQKLLKGNVPDAERSSADDDELLRSVQDVAAVIWSGDHWDARAQAIESALTNRLRAADKTVSPGSLMQELAECAEADLATILNLDDVPAAAAELATLRKLVHVRIQLSARQQNIARNAAYEAASILAAEGVRVPAFRLRAWATRNGVTAVSDIVDAWLHLMERR